MLSALLSYLNCLDWTDETILKAVKNLVSDNLTADQFDQMMTAHERRYKLRALVKNDDNE